jgi:hypothetical protein
MHLRIVLIIYGLQNYCILPQLDLDVAISISIILLMQCYILRKTIDTYNNETVINNVSSHVISQV